MWRDIRIALAYAASFWPWRERKESGGYTGAIATEEWLIQPAPIYEEGAQTLIVERRPEDAIEHRSTYRRGKKQITEEDTRLGRLEYM